VARSVPTAWFSSAIRVAPLSTGNRPGWRIGQIDITERRHRRDRARRLGPEMKSQLRAVEAPHGEGFVTGLLDSSLNRPRFVRRIDKPRCSPRFRQPATMHRMASWILVRCCRPRGVRYHRVTVPRCNVMNSAATRIIHRALTPSGVAFIVGREHDCVVSGACQKCMA